MQHIETDYLVIGSGTAGLAFADTLLREDQTAHITIVDRHGKPGGHWNDAYDFVTLHQPSAFYGVNSLELGSGRKDTSGLNQGLFELATGPELCAYFDQVMQRQLLPSGRVSYHPMCNYRGPQAGAQADSQAGAHAFESLLSGQRTQVQVRKKLVDAHYYSPSVPSTHRPRFEIGAGVKLVSPNALPKLGQGADAEGDSSEKTPKNFIILGAGKTAMDAVIWLINKGTDPEQIHWVMPRDSWLVNRITTQPAPEFFKEAIGSQADQMQALAQATSTADLFLRLEACGALLRIHPDQTPSMFHLATVAPGEVEVLRRVQNVIRKGRARALHAERMELDGGSAPVPPGSLFVDCTASAVEPRPTLPIFQGNKIVLQIARLPQPAFSAALTAYVEAHYEGDTKKNALCASVPFPHTLDDYPRAVMVNMWNQFQWGQDKALRQWIRDSRLDGFGRLMVGIAPEETEKLAIMARFKEQAMAAMANLQRLTAATAKA